MFPEGLVIHIGLYLSVKDALSWYMVNGCHALGQQVYLDSAKSPRGAEESPRAWSFILRNFAWSRFLRYLDQNPLARKCTWWMYAQMATWKRGWIPERRAQLCLTRYIASTFCPTLVRQPSRMFVRAQVEFPYFELRFMEGGTMYRLQGGLLTAGGMPVAKLYPQDVWYYGRGWSRALSRRLQVLHDYPEKTLTQYTPHCPSCGLGWSSGGMSEACMHALMSFSTRPRRGTQVLRYHQMRRVPVV